MFFQLLLSGISQGSIYALAALGMTILFRSTTVVNFGHGEFFMFGAFGVYVFLNLFEFSFPLAVVLALIMMFVVGVVCERLLIRPMLTAPHVAIAMMTVAISYLFRGIARVFWGRDVLPMPPVFSFPPIELGGVVVTTQDLIITGTTLTLMLVFFVFFYFTRVGKIAQAASQNLRGAALVGINVPRFFSSMWGVAAVMGAVGGILVAPVTLLYPDMGAYTLIRAFAAMTLGGFGLLSGAIVGGLLMGLIEQFAGAYISTALIDIAAYLVIIIVLIFKPSGLLKGKDVSRV